MRARRIAALTAGVALVGTEAVLLRHHLAAAFDAVGTANIVWVLVAVVATAASMNGLARVERRMLHAAGRDLSFPRMVGLAYVANALNATLPAGSAISAGFVVKRLRTWGATPAAAGFTVLASGALSSVTFFALAAAAALIGGGSAVGYAGGLAVLAAVVLAAVVLAAVVLARLRPALVRSAVARGERALTRISARAAVAVRGALSGVTSIRPQTRDWVAGAGFAALNWVADLVCLIAACHAVGMSGATPALVLTAYIAGMSASSIAFLPGGFGVVEVAMIGTLHAGRIDVDAATAAVLMYRLVSCVLVVCIGWLVWYLTVARSGERGAPQLDTTRDVATAA
jgi:uncharacterized protein (TIRG00374 family)